MTKNTWVLRWESRHPFYRVEAFFQGHRKRPILGSNYSKLMCIGENNKVQMYYLNDDLIDKKGKSLEIFYNKKMIQDYVEKTKNNYMSLINSLKNTINSTKNLDNKELLDVFKVMFERIEILLCSYDLSRPEYFEAVEEFLLKEFGQTEIPDEEIPDIFSILTTNTENTILDDEEIERLKLTVEAKKSGDISEKKLIRHQKKYGWIGTSEKEEEWDISYYRKQIQDEMKLPISQIESNIRTKLKSKKEIIKKQERILNERGLSEEAKYLLEIIKQFSHLRLNLRLKWVEAGYLNQALFKEIEKRTGVASKNLEKYTLNELESLLIENNAIPNDRIIQRKNYSFILEGEQLSVFWGDEAEKIQNEQIEDKDYSSIDELRGNIANPGRFSGFVKIINSLTDDQEGAIEEMQDGEILVTGMTRPHLIQAMKKSGAIITDEGGICCHAAIVSRELGKPCIVGTNVATKVFKNGDYIEVDAHEGIIRRLK